MSPRLLKKPLTFHCKQKLLGFGSAGAWKVGWPSGMLASLQGHMLVADGDVSAARSGNILWDDGDLLSSDSCSLINGSIVSGRGVPVAGKKGTAYDDNDEDGSPLISILFWFSLALFPTWFLGV